MLTLNALFTGGATLLLNSLKHYTGIPSWIRTFKKYSRTLEKVLFHKYQKCVSLYSILYSMYKKEVISAIGAAAIGRPYNRFNCFSEDSLYMLVK